MNRKLMLLVIACLASVVAGSGCSRISQTVATVYDTTHASAPELMIQYGCPTCHVIPGVPGAAGKVGPPLNSLAQRSYLAGTLPNTPADLQRWVMHPQSIHPGTAMPEMGINSNDAAEIAEFLEK